MDKEKLGNHFIGIGTNITDNRTHLTYEIVEILKEGFKLKLVSALDVPSIEFISYDLIETFFSSGDISIYGYEITDIKILHLVLIELRKTDVSVKKQFKQVGVNGPRDIKKKVKKISLKGI